MSGYDPAESSFYDIINDRLQDLEDDPEWDASDGLGAFEDLDPFEDGTHDETRRYGYQHDNGDYLNVRIYPDTSRMELKLFTAENEQKDRKVIHTGYDTLEAEKAVNQIIGSAKDNVDQSLAP